MARARPAATDAEWTAAFRELAPCRALYQDRFILLSPGPYSGISAAQMGMPASDWEALSLTIRLEHECAHYVTRRAFGSMRNAPHDELIADYAGITAAAGRYRADWFLRFMGLENFPAYRAGARLESYRGDPPLSDAAFCVLHALVKRAAETVEAVDTRRCLPPVAMVVALTRLTLEDLAADDACARLEACIDDGAGHDAAGFEGGELCDHG